LDPVLAFRASGYRAQKAVERPVTAPSERPTHL
jgi:L-rhamnose isomerase